MGNFAENLNLGNRFCPPPPPPVIMSFELFQWTTHGLIMIKSIILFTGPYHDGGSHIDMVYIYVPAFSDIAICVHVGFHQRRRSPNCIN